MYLFLLLLIELSVDARLNPGHNRSTFNGFRSPYNGTSKIVLYYSQCQAAQAFLLALSASYSTMMNGGTLLRAHCMEPTDIVTSVALDQDWVVVGLSSGQIHVFSSRTGVLARTLVGHDSGVWGVCLVGRGGSWVGERLNTDGGDAVPAMWRTPLGLDLPVGDTLPVQFPGKRSSPCSASDGWGQPNALVVSGGCDTILRVWDVRSGDPIHVLSGHRATIRCLKMLHNRPIAVTGSRDATLRVWDVQRGRMLRAMTGHTGCVRCLDVCGNRAVSGSDDATCRVWNIHSGKCIHVLRGHSRHIYSVAFDGVRIASGGLDTTVRVWDAVFGHCLAVLQGHTALVCQLQLAPSLPTGPHPHPILVTGASDGRVVTFSLATYTALHRIAAHDASVTALQCDARWLVTAGNDGRVRLWESATGAYVRELSEGAEVVWKVCFGGWNEDAVHGGSSEDADAAQMGPGAVGGREDGGDVLAIMCKRAGESVVEIWSFGPQGMP